jgi:hypothetical protein
MLCVCFMLQYFPYCAKYMSSISYMNTTPRIVYFRADISYMSFTSRSKSPPSFKKLDWLGHEREENARFWKQTPQHCLFHFHIFLAGNSVSVVRLVSHPDYDLFNLKHSYISSFTQYVKFYCFHLEILPKVASTNNKYKLSTLSKGVPLHAT